jgi:hypothetical protein
VVHPRVQLPKLFGYISHVPSPATKFCFPDEPGDELLLIDDSPLAEFAGPHSRWEHQGARTPSAPGRSRVNRGFRALTSSRGVCQVYVVRLHTHCVDKRHLT